MRRRTADANSWPHQCRCRPDAQAGPPRFARCLWSVGIEHRRDFGMSGISRRFRFGVLVSRAESLGEWRETARRAEGLGYSTLLIADHFGQQLAPMPALVSA